MASAGPRPDLWPRTTRVLPWTIAAFAAMLFLVPFDAMAVTSAKPDRPLLIVILGLWMLTLAVMKGENRPRLSGSVLHGAILFFVVTAVLSLLLNADTLRIHGELGLGMKKLLLLLCFSAVFVVTASALRPGEARNFIPLIVGLGCVAAIGSVWEYRTGYNVFYEIGGKFIPGGLDVPSVATEKDATGRIPVLGPTIHPLAVAQLLAMVVPFAVVGGLYGGTTRRKVFYGVALLILLAGVFATQRKTGPIVLAAGILTIFIYRPKQMMRVAPAGLLLLLAVPLVAPSALGSVRDQLKPGAATSTLSSRDRLSDYEAIGPEILNHPALGRGWQTYDPERYRVLDNEYLSILIGNGYLGVAAFALLLIAALAVCTRAIRTDDPARAPPALAAAGVVTMVAVASATFDTIAFAVVPYAFCLMLGLAAACAPPPKHALAQLPERLRIPAWIPRGQG
ncbi:MAG TPA: O-antigen ligase family protein [Solirubrobacterales bacterium]|nr:O-antigen ligase family protein [Solirubrobacterales bacterium]